MVDKKNDEEDSVVLKPIGPGRWMEEGENPEMDAILKEMAAEELLKEDPKSKA